MLPHSLTHITHSGHHHPFQSRTKLAVVGGLCEWSDGRCEWQSDGQSDCQVSVCCVMCVRCEFFCVIWWSAKSNIMLCVIGNGSPKIFTRQFVILFCLSLVFSDWLFVLCCWSLSMFWFMCVCYILCVCRVVVAGNSVKQVDPLSTKERWVLCCCSVVVMCVSSASCCLCHVVMCGMHLKRRLTMVSVCVLFHSVLRPFALVFVCDSYVVCSLYFVVFTVMIICILLYQILQLESSVWCRQPEQAGVCCCCGIDCVACVDSFFACGCYLGRVSGFSLSLSLTVLQHLLLSLLLHISHTQLDVLLSQLVTNCDVDILPGATDPATLNFPQQVCVYVWCVVLYSVHECSGENCCQLMLGKKFWVKSGCSRFDKALISLRSCLRWSFQCWF